MTHTGIHGSGMRLRISIINELTLVHALRDKHEFNFNGGGWDDADAMSFAKTLQHVSEQRVA